MGSLMATVAMIAVAIVFGFWLRRRFDLMAAKAGVKSDDVLEKAFGTMTYDQLLAMEAKVVKERVRRERRQEEVQT